MPFYLGPEPCAQGEIKSLAVTGSALVVIGCREVTASSIVQKEVTPVADETVARKLSKRASAIGLFR